MSTGKESVDSVESAWKSPVGYIWAMIGSAVGFANILGFGAKCYQYGGGAFLIPLLIAFIVFGVPLLILEGVIGQSLRLPLVSAYGAVAGRVGKFFGWLTIIGLTTIGAYYCVINAWTLAYIFFSSTNSIPANTEDFFNNVFLRDSGSLMSWGSFSWVVVFFTILVSLFTWIVTVKNIQNGIERICSIFLPILSLLLIVFGIAVCFLPGAWQGFAYYIVPDFSKLANPQLWLISFGHVFFSLSVALALIVGYSRYIGKEVNIAHSMFWVAVGDLLTSFVAGFVIFGGLGYMSYLTGVAFESVSKTSLFGLGFVVFPKLISTFGASATSIVGSLFFFCLFIAGITGIFSIVEAISGNLEVEFVWSRPRSITVSVIIVFLCALFFCGGNSMYLIGAMDGMTAGFNVLISGFAEILVFMYFSRIVIDNGAWFLGTKRAFYYYTLKFIAPFLLAVIFCFSLATELQSGFGFDKIIRWIWLLLASLISFILSYKK